MSSTLILLVSFLSFLSFSSFSEEIEVIEIAELKEEYARPDSIPFPEDNPLTQQKLELGKALYFDPRLSDSGTQSCATCHNPSFSWGDGMGLGVGH